MAGLHQDDVASLLTRDLPSRPNEDLGDAAAGPERQRATQTETSTSWIVTLRGIPRSARTARH